MIKKIDIFVQIADCNLAHNEGFFRLLGKLVMRVVLAMGLGQAVIHTKGQNTQSARPEPNGAGKGSRAAFEVLYIHTRIMTCPEF